MRFSVEAWATEYGSPMEADQLELSENAVNLIVECPTERWAPVSPPQVSEPDCIVFTDGVRRIDGRVWIEVDGQARPGVCATYAAGAMRCDGRAGLAAATVERGLFSAVVDAEPIRCRHATYDVRRAQGDSPEELWIAIQERMGMLEGKIAGAQEADLVVVDGPLKGVHGVPRAVGFVKTHHVAYLPPELNSVVAALEPGQRTPVFLTTGRWGRFSWYVKLPGGAGHLWAGVVRCEATADLEVEAAVELADMCATVLPRFASEPHKDPRAPQNLYPIAGLERDLRRRLGDPQLLYRGLKVAANQLRSA